MALVKIGDVWQNILTLLILFLTVYIIYKSMHESKAKQAIRDLIEKIKPEGKNGK